MSKSALFAHLLIGLACWAGAAAPTLAGCREDINELRARLDASPARNANVVNARKELAKAEQEVKFDEVGCDNAVTRAWRAYKAHPAPQGQANGAATPR
jgi:hypothetical protein